MSWPSNMDSGEKAIPCTRCDLRGAIKLSISSLITERMICHGFLSVRELERAMYTWLANWNDSPRPFVWKATAEVILGKIRRCKELAGTGD